MMIRIFFLCLCFCWPTAIPAQQWTLTQCLEYALRNHPAIRQNMLDIDKADQNIALARLSLLPSVSAGIRHSYSFGSTIDPATNSRQALNTQYDQFSINAPVELFNWKNYLNIRLASINKGSAEFRLKEVQNEVSLNVIQKFFQYQYARAWHDVLDNQIAGIEAQIVRTEKEVEIGSRPKSDIYDIRANMGSIRQEWISALNQKETARNDLENAVGKFDDSIEFVFDKEGQDLLVDEQADMVKQLLGRNPLYWQATAQVEAAEENVRISRADFLPKITGAYQWSTFFSRQIHSQPVADFNRQFSQNQNSYAGLGLDIPLFNRFQARSKIALTRLEAASARLEREKVVLNLTAAIREIEIQYRNARRNFEILDQNFENQRLSFEKSEEKYREGMMDAYTFFAVRNSWLQANYNLIKSRYDLMLEKELLKVYMK